tara:strand:+ start:68 stop:433 length:366 start_codon:yes stop_codon:yes gene_type:complete
MKKIIFAMAAILILQACGQDQSIQIIKNGSFNACGKANIGDLVNNFFDGPSWTAIESVDGRKYVNLEGEMTYDEIPADALVQFTAPLTEYASFEINAFEINGVGQNQFMIGALVSAMCDEY